MGQLFQGTVVCVDPAENWEVAGRPAGEQDLQSHLKAQHLETSPLRTNGRITSFRLQRQMDLETGEIQGIYSRPLVLRFCHPSWCPCSKHLTMVKWSLNIYRTGIFIGLLSWILHYLFLSVGKSCLTLCDSMHCNTPGFPVLHYFLEFAQTHVHWIGDAIQPSHPLPPPSPPAFNLSQHQGLFQCQFFASDGQSIGVSASAAVLPMNIQGCFPLGLTGLICLQSKGLSRVFSSTHFESINSLALSLLYGPALTSIHDYWTNHSFDYMGLCWQSDVSVF